MTKQTEFFTELIPMLKGIPVTINITPSKSGIVVLDFLPGGRHEDNELKPLRLKGTPEDFNNEFLHKVEAVAAVILENGLTDTLTEFAKSAEEMSSEDRKETTKASTPKTARKKEKINPAEAPESGSEVKEVPKEITEDDLRKKYTKTGTTVLENKLKQEGLPSMDETIINEILSTRADRTPPAKPKHEAAVITEITRLVNAQRRKATITKTTNEQFLIDTTDIEERAPMETEIQSAQAIINKCDIVLLAIKNENYGYATDGTLINKEALLANPLEY